MIEVPGSFSKGDIEADEVELAPEVAEQLEADGKLLLNFDDLVPEQLHPRNSLILIRNLGEAESRMVGKLHMPNSQMGHILQVGQVIGVGPGTPNEFGSHMLNTSDLEPGDVIIYKAEGQVRGNPGARGKMTLSFRVGEQEIELLNETDILFVVDMNDATPEGDSK